jgi:hypothetical protein
MSWPPAPAFSSSQLDSASFDFCRLAQQGSEI